MLTRTPQRGVPLSLGLLFYGGFVSANSTTQYQYPSDIFPQLDLDSSIPPPSRDVSLGGQNFTQCCVIALASSLTVRNGSLYESEDSVLVGGLGNITEFQVEAQRNFPCGASFDGNPSGAPIIQVSYDWCMDNCKGWQVSQHNVLLQWIGPMVGFIIPAVAFVLNIPRSWKIATPDAVWHMTHGRRVKLISYIIKMPLALLLVTIDIAVWSSCCFAFAGPLLLSGCYEASFDLKLLRQLEREMTSYTRGRVSLTEELRARLLFMTLVGNIQLSEDHTDPEQEDPVEAVAQLTHDLGFDHPIRNTLRVKNQLSSLLVSHSNFGYAVGAPVVFFVGAFVYNLFDISSKSGDNDTAHALAFGMWWMVIPFLSIVSGTLLASDNQSTFSAIVEPTSDLYYRPLRYLGGEDSKHNRRGSETPSIGSYILSGQIFTPEGRFKTVSLWDRGPNKIRWLKALIDDYVRRRHSLQDIGTEELAKIERFRKEMIFTPLDNGIVLGQTFLVVLVPCLLAFLTSYHTPRVGLSCRSLTHLLYFCTQFLQVAVWMVRASSKKQGAPARPLSLATTVIFGTLAMFTGMGGTLMQLIGVYRNCLCKLPATYWLRTREAIAYVPLSTDMAEAIEMASMWWQNTAIAAIIFLCMSCVLGWWHQRRLRMLFGILVAHVDQCSR